MDQDARSAGNNGEIQARRREIRWLLIALGVPNLAVAVWILVAPHSFYAQFPFGRKWVEHAGAYDEHLLRDFGSGLLGLTTLLVLAGVVMHRRVVQLALVAWLLYSVPHFLFHAFNTQTLSAGDNVANLVVLGAIVVVPLWLLVMVSRQGTAGRPAAAGGSAGADASAGAGAVTAASSANASARRDAT